MSTKVFCDRCSKEIRGPIYELSAASRRDSPDAVPDLATDLCRDCRLALSDWMLPKKAKGLL